MKMQDIETIAEKIDTELNKKDIFFAWRLSSNLNILEVSEGVKKILGYYPEELVSTNFKNYMLNQEARYFEKELKNDDFKYKNIFFITNIFKRKDKTHIVLETRGRTIFDEKGDLMGFEGLSFYR